MAAESIERPDFEVAAGCVLCHHVTTLEVPGNATRKQVAQRFGFLVTEHLCRMSDDANSLA